MKDGTRIMVGALAFAGAISALHAWLNVDWASITNDNLPEAERKLNIAYIPVT